MPKDNMFDPTNPGGGLIDVISEKTTVVGGQHVAYPTSPGISRTPKHMEAVKEQLREHDLMLYGLVREIVTMRRRLGWSSE